MKKIDSRLSPRIPVKMKVSYTFDKTNWYSAMSSDISSSGMFIITRDIVQPGRKILVKFRLPYSKWNEPIQALGKVVRVVGPATIGIEGKNPGIGIKFLKLRAYSEEILLGFIKESLIDKKAIITQIRREKALSARRDAESTSEFEKLSQEVLEAIEKEELKRAESFAGLRALEKTNPLMYYLLFAAKLASLSFVAYFCFKLILFTLTQLKNW